MPNLLIYGLPSDLQGTSALHRLVTSSLPHEIAGAPGMGIDPRLVAVRTPFELFEYEDPNLYVTVTDLFVRPGRTAEVLQGFADIVSDHLLWFALGPAADQFNGWKRIETVVPSANAPDGSGFAVASRTPDNCVG